MNKHYDLNSIQFNQDTDQPYIINIAASFNSYDVHTFKIGFYNFKEKFGVLTQLNGTRKEYKQFQSIMNYFFKQDDMFGWDSTTIEATKLYAKQLIKQEKKQVAEQFKAEQTNKATAYLTNIINRDQATVECLSNFTDKEDYELIEIINNTFKGQLTNEMVYNILDEIKAYFRELDNSTPEERLLNDKEITNIQLIDLINKYDMDVPYSAIQLIKNKVTTVQFGCVSSKGRLYTNDINTIVRDLIEVIENKQSESIEEVATTVEQTTEQPEQFHLYSNTFNTYSDAFNYACEHVIPVHMILSSNHPTMTNQRLQHLEHEYTFSKMQMSIQDKREYFDYLTTCQRSLDQENRYYKLKTWIERYEYQQESIKQRKEDDLQLTKEAYKLVEEMESHGLIIESTRDCGTSSTKYILNGEILHNWIGSGGLETEKYYSMIKSIYDKFKYNKVM